MLHISTPAPLGSFLEEKLSSAQIPIVSELHQKMEYVQLGKCGLKVSKVILGCMSFGSSKWQRWVLDEAESIKVLKAAYDAGITTWDTAIVYSNGDSERAIGKAIKQHHLPRSKLVLCTKVYCPGGPDWTSATTGNVSSDGKDYIDQYCLSRRSIYSAVDESLERLGTTYIDLLWIHRVDRNVPKEETMSALHAMIVSGKVRYIGACSMYAWEFAEYQHVAEKHGWTKFVAMQSAHSLLYVCVSGVSGLAKTLKREEEREMFPYCKATGVGTTPWYSLHAGKLTRPLEKSTATDRGSFKGWTNGISFEETPLPDQDIINRVEELSEKYNCSMATLAVAWSMTKVDAPIVGINKVERVADFVAALKLQLSDEDRRYLEEPYLPKAIMGNV